MSGLYRILVFVLIGILLSFAVGYIVVASADDALAVGFMPTWTMRPAPTPAPTPAPYATPVIIRMTSGISAEKNTTNIIPANNNTRISQGQCVEVGGVYDVSGVIGFTFTESSNQFAYHGKYETSVNPSDNSTISYIYKMPNDRKSYYMFYINPEIFEDRLGYWYQYSGAYERGANKQAFYVSDRCIRNINESAFVDENNKPILINPYVMEQRHATDILLSNDDPLFLNDNGLYRMWVFGLNNQYKILSRDVNITSDIPLFDESQVKEFRVGSYTILLQNTGNNSLYELGYEINNRTSFDKDMLIPALRTVDTIDITGYQPRMIQDKVEYILKNFTDDTYIKYNMDVQNPYVEITGYQEIRLGNTSFGNLSKLEVTGYTNKIPGTKINLIIDMDKISLKPGNKFQTMTIITEGGNIGDYRTFHGYIDLDYTDLAFGYHDLTAVLQDGSKSTVSFYIREEPKPYYTEPTYYKFVDGHPFIPIPTPEIIIKEVVKEVEKIKYVTVIEKEPVDYNTLATKNVEKSFPYVVAVIIIGMPALYVISVVIRMAAKRITEMRKKD
jgi:hypothetical protein